MTEHERTNKPIGSVHATVALSGEAKLVAAELERLRVGGLIDRVLLEVVVPRARLDPTPEIKRLPPIKRGDVGGALSELKTVEHKLDGDQVAFVTEVVRRFEAITE
jgi:hypothetical protein